MAPRLWQIQTGLGRDKLYNLKNDPEETTNLIAAGTPEVATITEQLHASSSKR